MPYNSRAEMTSPSPLAVVAARSLAAWCTLQTAAILFVCFTMLSFPTHASGGLTFLSVLPQKGPQDGGTRVSIHMSNPDSYRPTEVWFGEHPVTVDNSFDDDFIYVRTPNVSNNDVGMPQSVSVQFLDESGPFPTGFNFTFLPDPKIDSISPRQYIYNGGITLTVSGRGLDISDSPILEVTTVTSLLVNSVVQTNRVTYQSICSNFTNTQLLCILPALYIPDVVTSYLKSIQPPFGGNGGVAFSIPEAVKSLVSQGYVDDGRNNTVYVYVGLIFDGDLDYGNLTSKLKPNGSTVLIAGPVIQKWNRSVEVTHWKNPTFTIQGAMLTYGCGEDDYAVHLESVKCDIQQINSDHEGAGTIVITLPVNTDGLALKPHLFPQFVCDGPEDLHLQVSVGYRWYDVACITPLTPCSSRPCLNNGNCSYGSDFTYSCECHEGYYGNHCEYEVPWIANLSPSYGPQAGGTVVTIMAEVPPQYFTPVGVFFEEIFVTAELEVVLYNDKKMDIIFQTPASLQEDAFPVTVSFNWSNPTRDNTLTTFTTVQNRTLMFTYLPNPIISEMSPYEYLYTGGTTMTVNGTNLFSVAAPYLNVTMTTRWQVIGQEETEQKAYFLSLCNVISNTEMSCPFPVIDVPTDLIAYLDQLPYKNEFKPRVTPNCLDQPYETPKLTSDTNTQFLVGFILDGLTNYSSYDVVYVFSPPIICSNRTLSLKDAILGNHLLRGVSSKDYSVVIGFNWTYANSKLYDGSLIYPNGLSAKTLDTRLKVETLQFAWIRFTSELFTVNDTNIQLHQLSINDGSLVNGSLDFPDRGSWECSEYYFLNLMVIIAGIEYTVGCANPSYNATCTTDYCMNGGICVQYATEADCLCAREYFGEFCQYGIPLLNKVSPEFGPQDGGTLITITGTYYNYSTPISVTFNSPINFTTENFTRYGNDIVLRTPPSKYNDTSITITVSFSTTHLDDKHLNIVVNGTFTYWPNPSIERFFPSHHIVTGGTTVFMTGINLNVSSEITMTIVVQTVFQTTNLEGKNVPVANVQTFPTTNCELLIADDRTALYCDMPVTQVPAEFYPLLGTEIDVTDQQGPRRRRRRRKRSSTDQTMDTVGQQVHRRYRRYAELRSPSSGAVMKVLVVMRFDGYEVNLSEDNTLRDNATLVLHRPPIINIPSDVISYYPDNGQQVEIDGVNLTVGSEWIVDMTVSVGGRYVPIANCTSRMVRLTLPDVPTNMTSLVELNPATYANRCRADGQQLDSWVNVSNVYILTIRIGYEIFPAGCIHYAYTVPPPEDAYTLMGTYVGVSFGVAILIVLSFAACTSSGSSTTTAS